MDNLENDNWSKAKEKFAAVILFPTFFFTMSFFSTPIYTENELKIETKVYRTCRISNGKHDYITLYFLNDNEAYTIYRIDKQYLNQKKFSQIKSGDELRVMTHDYDILDLYHNGVDLMNIKKANQHKYQNRNFVRYLSLLWMILIIIPTFFSRQPTLKFRRLTYQLKLDWYYIGFGILLTLILILLIDSPNPNL